ncbi:MAG: NAD-dependent epimerase/dehydratase family protein [Flavobacteriaceae bacterium]|uniref:NAD-dependent epimerase/dehydratase family protein n=1 Tax=Flavobacterium kayseriense TaxID=2764714 RepID=A0ABR7J437_9FLAO|nr:NAD-dependent epimerase/dehydratase family protein [Flavobacterium kayseriense]MBC5840222.1 NAD-dependent epimerase/dehydratase family protein [Flavobacterium kayseriense]MBC5847108.1 NAD-dependent epimerase/dehydratase family protein [Flavobacterium kayseriense]MBU0940421.1 NAD-dependent epimerase/dehydratase family protein [Bacteroidota bacterium]MBX9888034.1 NAD-dependent epimerase/dehydratase family protein [Flavobacteriaceae bacterium]
MILVTGGTGLVGAHLLVHILSHSDENQSMVRATYRTADTIDKTKSLFDRYHKTILFDRIEWVQADIINIPALEIAFKGITLVYHCAAFISFDSKDEEKLRKINIEGTANIVNFAIAKGIKKLCHISSTAALGDVLSTETIITEAAEWNPEKKHSDYAISKYGAEMEVWRGQQEGLDVIIVNPGVIVGPGFEDQGSGELIKKVEKGMPYYTLGTTGFIAVTDVATIVYNLMNSTIKNERYTLIAQNIIYRDFLNTVANAIGVKAPKREASPFLIEIAWRIDAVVSWILNRKRKLTQAVAVASYSTNMYSNEKIKTALDYQFLDVHTYIKKSFS